MIKIMAYSLAFATCLTGFTQSASAEKIKGLGLIHVPGFFKDMSSFEQSVRTGKSSKKTVFSTEAALFTNEPYFRKVKFSKLEPAMSLEERVDRLLYGIYTDVPPEYDHYGYELRRYMAAIGSVDVYLSEKSVDGQLQNIKNANIIIDYWEKAINKEIDDIEEKIEQRNDSVALRTRFKYNRGVVKAFMIEARSWIRANQRILEYMKEVGDRNYKVSQKTQILSFKTEEGLEGYAKLYKEKMPTLMEMRSYMPFRMMVY